MYPIYNAANINPTPLKSKLKKTEKGEESVSAT